MILKTWKYIDTDNTIFGIKIMLYYILHILLYIHFVALHISVSFNKYSEPLLFNMW